MSYTNQDLRKMLEDVVNVLDLSEDMLEKHVPLGTPPSELVRLELEQKDLQIAGLRRSLERLTERFAGIEV